MKKEIKRNRENIVKIYLSDEEMKILLLKMKAVEMTNKNEFCRELIMRGRVILLERKVGIDELVLEVNAAGKNINQIAKVCNSTGSFYLKDLKKLQEEINNMNEIIGNIYDRMTVENMVKNYDLSYFIDIENEIKEQKKMEIKERE